MSDHDVLVVGGGTAGLRAAIEAKRQGASVLLVSKTHPLRSHSCTFQAGVNAPLKPGDSWEAFAADTINGGDFLNEQPVVEALCQEAGAAVRELDAWGVPFSREPSGKLAARRLSGSSQARACFAGDITGHVILQTLYEQMLRLQIEARDECQALALVVSDGVCHGVVARELRTGRIVSFGAKAVVLATGGMGQLFRRTTASLGCTGDGVALAYRAGARLMDMEMLQFHPTVLAGKGVLVTEAVLAEGAMLTSNGQPFLKQEAPGSGDLAPRAVVARAIAEEAQSGRPVMLDATGLDPAKASRPLKHTRELLLGLKGLDLFKQPVPVSPAMHRSMGGVRTDLEGATSLKGLFAAGECAATGVHGANRLGGSSITENMVFGKRAGAAAARHSRDASARAVPESLVKVAERRTTPTASRTQSRDNVPGLRVELQDVMDRDLGLRRDAGGLQHAQGAVAGLKARLALVAIPGGGEVFDVGVTGYVELENLLLCAEAVAASALVRTESRGSHYRADFPSRDDGAWLKHTLVTQVDGVARTDTAPVTVTRWPPAARKL